MMSFQKHISIFLLGLFLTLQTANSLHHIWFSHDNSLQKNHTTISKIELGHQCSVFQQISHLFFLNSPSIHILSTEIKYQKNVVFFYLRSEIKLLKNQHYPRGPPMLISTV
ncbi:hypothetical protein GGR32_000776 [Mesonia hippocampi]|uniref:Uncharacterized protein n=1 Tax=Mesonia hippocampi TaxID=1628250 RepID=A0A840EGV5_9FLAO|nr:hypothetical protein [Mesonia hippocampi]